MKHYTTQEQLAALDRAVTLACKSGKISLAQFDVLESMQASLRATLAAHSMVPPLRKDGSEELCATCGGAPECGDCSCDERPACRECGAPHLGPLCLLCEHEADE